MGRKRKYLKEKIIDEIVKVSDMFTKKDDLEFVAENIIKIVKKELGKELNWFWKKHLL